MKYNTQQKKMALPEYGRSVQNMVDYAITIKDPAERQRCANTIVSIMGNMFPHLRDIPDFKYKLWDHLAIMSDFKLDIEYPYGLVDPSTFTVKPGKIEYNSKEIAYKHYGRALEHLINKACEMPDDDKKQQLVALICNHMKKSYITWNKDSVDDAKIATDLENLSGGRLHMDDEIKKVMAERLALYYRPKNNMPNNRNNGQKKRFY